MLALLVVEEREGLQGIEDYPGPRESYQAPASYDRRMPLRLDVTSVIPRGNYGSDDRRYGVLNPDREEV